MLAATFSAGVVIGELHQTSQTRREPQFENEHVRVWKSIILPNQPLALHRDHGRTIVALKGGTLDVVDEKGDGERRWHGRPAGMLAGLTRPVSSTANESRHRTDRGHRRRDAQVTLLVLRPMRYHAGHLGEAL
jgi:hypothetical protein